MEYFFEALKSTHDISKSIQSTQEHLKYEADNIYKLQNDNVLSLEKAEKIYENNFNLLKKQQYIKDLD